MLLMLVWIIKHIGHSSTRTFKGTKIVFPFNFHLHQVSHYIVITYIISIHNYCT